MTSIWHLKNIKYSTPLSKEKRKLLSITWEIETKMRLFLSSLLILTLSVARTWRKATWFEPLNKMLFLEAKTLLLNVFKNERMQTIKRRLFLKFSGKVLCILESSLKSKLTCKASVLKSRMKSRPIEKKIVLIIYNNWTLSLIQLNKSIIKKWR